MCISYRFPGDAAVADPGTTGWHPLTSCRELMSQCSVPPSHSLSHLSHGCLGLLGLDQDLTLILFLECTESNSWFSTAHPCCTSISPEEGRPSSMTVVLWCLSALFLSLGPLSWGGNIFPFLLASGSLNTPTCLLWPCPLESPFFIVSSCELFVLNFGSYCDPVLGYFPPLGNYNLF